METARCKAFLASAETGSFTKAAERLNYTPSGVSQLVTALEKDLGFTLLNRTKRGVQVTDMGEAILPNIRELLRQEECLYQIAGEFNNLEIGTVSIGTYSSIASHWLPAVIKRFNDMYPGITIHLLEGNQREIDGWLCDKTVEIAFYSEIPGNKNDWFPLEEIALQAIIPSFHPFAQKEAFPVEQFGKEPVIVCASGHDDITMDVMEQFHIKPEIKFTTLESYSAMSMVEQGIGISLTNELVMQGMEYHGATLPLDPPLHTTFGVAVQNFEKSSPATKKFLKFAVQSLSKAKK